MPLPGTTTRRCRSAYRCKGQRPARRKTARKPSEIPFNTGEGLRAAYYVPYDPASYSSFKEHVHQIDLLFPEWLHIDAPQAALLAMSSDNHHEYPVIEGNTVHDPDDQNRIKRVIQAAKEDTEIFPHLNNFNPNTQSWDPAIAATAGRRRTSAPRCASRSCVSLPLSRPIAASRWTLKTCRMKPARRI